MHDAGMRRGVRAVIEKQVRMCLEDERIREKLIQSLVCVGERAVNGESVGILLGFECDEDATPRFVATLVWDYEEVWLEGPSEPEDAGP